jgi:glutamate/tyrosine decarboxylase-like PLP-dependent enzyme
VENKQEIRLADLADQVISAVDRMKETYGDFAAHHSQQADLSRVRSVLEDLTTRLEDNFPYFHPHYAGQMLKPPHPVAMAAYIATMMINPNNHSIDGGRATTMLEREVVKDLARMFGYPDTHLGHLTWSGTTANLEALWVSREINPDLAIAHSEDSHYTHTRMAEVLNIPAISIATDEFGRMRLDDLAEKLATGKIGTVVATLGTTGLGAVDPLADIITLARQYGARVHVDTAYGGFFTLIADDLDEETARHYRAIAQSDSVVVDPHKHGLQPYGCGAVLFNDVSIGRFYKHDSPYTYFASEDLHFGEIQLECSRAGASAAALWATLKIFPLTKDGLGSVLQGGRNAAVQWHKLLSESEVLVPLQAPELDIVTYLPRASKFSSVDAISQAIFEKSAQAPRDQQIHLATYVMKPQGFVRRGFELEQDRDTARILRSVLMKPEQENWIPDLHTHVETLAKQLIKERK